ILSTGSCFLPDPNYLSMFLNAGLVRDHDGSVELSHYSLDEFFMSRILRTQLLDYDARMLSRLDLIGAYNVNRFLVPMLRKSVIEKRPKIVPPLYSVNLNNGSV